MEKMIVWNFGQVTWRLNCCIEYLFQQYDVLYHLYVVFSPNMTCPIYPTDCPMNPDGCLIHPFNTLRS